MSAACSSARRHQGHAHLPHRGAPLSLGYDGSDSLLDPTRGFRLSGRISPEISAHGGQFTYARTQFDASAYHPVSDQRRRRRPRPARDDPRRRRYDIAPSRRFYSGGGGSVRGYGYQRLGPKDLDGDPIGGRGLAEFALEARIRLKQFGGNFGIVPFFDGGSLTTEALPDFKDWHFAAGLGVALLFELRPDPHRCRRAAQPREGRRPGRGHRLARPGLLAMAEAAVIDQTAAEPPPRRLRRDWPRRLLNELFALSSRLLFLLAGALVLLDTRARPPLHRRPHRQVRDRVGPEHPHRPHRRVDLRQVAAAERRRGRPAAACS